MGDIEKNESIVILNVPLLHCEQIIPTPKSKYNSSLTANFDVSLLELVGRFGEPMSVPHVRGGDIVQDIFPTEEEKGKASSSYGSEEEFVFHNDQSYCADEQDIPRLVMLGCVRNIERAQTLFTRVNDALQDLDDQDIELLKQPNFTFGHTMKKSDGKKVPSTNISPVLLENGEIRLGVDMCVSDGDSLRALNELRSSIFDHSIKHTLEPGDVAVIPNRTFVHARAPFVMASQPEQRRWLKRINIR